ncbi:MAG TPA: YdcF family protein [Candidatus Saccharimonadales bacterium]
MGTNKYDAIIVLCTNIRKTADGHRPTTYADYDQYGMLAGEINIVAAVLAYERGLADTFVFSTGSSEKTKAVYGAAVPAEAAVYSAEFLARIKNTDKPMPNVILEDRSVNTYSNITECYQIIRQYGWKNVAIMSAPYHIPRTQVLCDLAKTTHPIDAKLKFLVSEDLITQHLPGKYDKQIAGAYSSHQGQKRLRSEAQGLQDMKDGKYVVTEFQLHTLNKSAK